MVLFRKLLPPQHPRLFMNNIMLPETDNHKHLGLILSKSCTWYNHIQEIASKVWIRLNLMRNSNDIQTIHANSNMFNNSFSRQLFEHGIICLMKQKKVPLLRHLNCIWRETYQNRQIIIIHAHEKTRYYIQECEWSAARSTPSLQEEYRDRLVLPVWSFWLPASLLLQLP